MQSEPVAVFEDRDKREGAQVRDRAAYRGVFESGLPARVELTDADSMLQDRGLKGVDTLELVARVALGGSATAVAGDLESSTWVGPPSAESVSLHIDRRLP